MNSSFDKPRDKVLIVRSADRRNYYLLRDLLVEATDALPYIADRAALRHCMKEEQGSVPYIILDTRPDHHTIRASAMAYISRHSTFTNAFDATIVKGDVVIGCQHFTGENAKVLRRWIKGAR